MKALTLKLLLLTFAGRAVFAEPGIYVVVTASGESRTYTYPASAPGPASMPVINTDPDNCTATEPETEDGGNSGWGCNFVSEDTLNGYVNEYRQAADNSIHSYRDGLNATLAQQDNPPAPGAVLAEDRSLLQKVQATLDRANSFLTKHDTEQKALRQKFYDEARQRQLAEGDPRLKPGLFNRLVMGTTPQLDRFATLRMVNGLSMFPHGVQMPESRLWLTGGELFGMFRFALDLTEAGFGLSILEAAMGRRLTPPFERFSEMEQKFLYGAVFISHRQSFLRQMDELGSLEAVFAKNLGSSAVNTGALAGFKEILGSSKSLWYYTPVLRGPLHEISVGTGTVAETFRSGSYMSNLTSTEVKLYRSYGGGAPQLGAYYSRTKPTGPLQATMDVALHPSWGNAADHWVEITVPANSLIFEGPAAAQKTGTVEVLGGGSQVYVRGQVPGGWVTDSGKF